MNDRTTSFYPDCVCFLGETIERERERSGSLDGGSWTRVTSGLHLKKKKDQGKEIDRKTKDSSEGNKKMR